MAAIQYSIQLEYLFNFLRRAGCLDSAALQQHAGRAAHARNSVARAQSGRADIGRENVHWSLLSKKE
ncbi:hypothetical protein PSTH2693_15645 [Pseudomonas syringae pv. theae]|nr:hypothetical protein PSTH2693_15645 [Pseudomonas syringae pv. theae]